MKYSDKKSVYLREERDRALFDAYSKAIGEIQFASQCEAVDYVRTHEAPRFYIDGEFCRIVINRIRNGRPMNVYCYHQIERFKELARRFEIERADPRNKNLSTLAICNIIVEQKAPEFYLSNRRAREILASQKEIRCKEMLKRARL